MCVCVYVCVCVCVLGEHVCEHSYPQNTVIGHVLGI